MNITDKMQKIADKLGLTFDGGDDSRLFDDSFDIIVFAKAMSRKDYNEMENKISNFTVKGEGFSVYAWNDISGYDYWSDSDNGNNYIQITANISNPDIIDLKKLKIALSDAYDEFCCYDNIDEYYNELHRKAL